MVVHYAVRPLINVHLNRAIKDDETAITLVSQVMHAIVSFVNNDNMHVQQ